MKNERDGFGYNERLFSSGIRRRLHLARFKWLAEQIRNLKCAQKSVLELGCFDGKLIEFLPTRPSRYVGFDANWEGGLDLAAEKWKFHPNFFFHKAYSAADMSLESTERFDIAVAMETLEHVPQDLVDDYLRMIAQHLDGYFFVTVPNEKGIVFLAKWTVKKLLRGEDLEHYSFNELVNATLGRTALVSRREHKGFDYASLINDMSKYFDIIHVSGHPLGMLPCFLCFGIGIIAKPKSSRRAFSSGSTFASLSAL